MHLTEETDSWSLAEMQWILDLHAFAQKVSILLQQCQSSCDKILILILLEIFENTAFLFRFRLSRDHSTSYSSSVASMFSVVPSCSGAILATALEFVPALPLGVFDDSGLLNLFLHSSETRLFLRDFHLGRSALCSGCWGFC
jgi:hypothetical protein